MSFLDEEELQQTARFLHPISAIGVDLVRVQCIKPPKMESWHYDPNTRYLKQREAQKFISKRAAKVMLSLERQRRLPDWVITDFFGMDTIRRAAGEG